MSNDRRPLRFWQPFNEWWRAELERMGRRPNAQEIMDWYNENAFNLWGEEAPTIHETRVHAKCLRSLPLVREYFRNYRSKKKMMGTTGNTRSGSVKDDDEDAHADTAQGEDYSGRRQSGRRQKRTVRRHTVSDTEDDVQQEQDAQGYMGASNMMVNNYSNFNGYNNFNFNALPGVQGVAGLSLEGYDMNGEQATNFGGQTEMVQKYRTIQDLYTNVQLQTSAVQELKQQYQQRSRQQKKRSNSTNDDEAQQQQLQQVQQQQQQQQAVQVYELTPVEHMQAQGQGVDLSMPSSQQQQQAAQPSSQAHASAGNGLMMSQAHHEDHQPSTSHQHQHTHAHAHDQAQPMDAQQHMGYVSYDQSYYPHSYYSSYGSMYHGYNAGAMHTMHGAMQGGAYPSYAYQHSHPYGSMYMSSEPGITMAPAPHPNAHGQSMVKAEDGMDPGKSDLGMGQENGYSMGGMGPPSRITLNGTYASYDMGSMGGALPLNMSGGGYGIGSMGGYGDPSLQYASAPLDGEPWQGPSAGGAPPHAQHGVGAEGGSREDVDNMSRGQLVDLVKQLQSKPQAEGGPGAGPSTGGGWSTCGAPASANAAAGHGMSVEYAYGPPSGYMAPAPGYGPPPGYGQYQIPV